MSIETIYTKLISEGLTPVGACALMGNMRAESAMRSNNAQDAYGYWSEEQDMAYTAEIDRDKNKLVNGKVGYGLCQWTDPSRQAELAAFSRQYGGSIGDENMQVAFAIYELKTAYPSIWREMCEACDLYTMTAKICMEYEKPAVNNIDERAHYAKTFYMQLADKTEETRKKQEMPIVRRGDNTPEGKYLASLLRQKGYDVLWEGTYNCLVDYQRKAGLAVDGVCGLETWKKLMEE